MMVLGSGQERFPQPGSLEPAEKVYSPHHLAVSRGLEPCWDL